MSKIYKVYTDCDGVLLSWEEAKQKAARLLFDLDIPPNAFHDDLITKHISVEDYRKLQHYIYNGPESNKLKLVDGVLEFLPKLISQHNVCCVTARPKSGIDGPVRILGEYGIVIPMISVGNDDKLKALSDYKVDVYIDDKLSVLIPLIGHVKHLFLYNWAYNRHEILPKEIIRVESWKEFHYHVQHIK